MSSKFLDKTGLDTLWAKIKSTFQTLGNLVTAWGSSPSDSKYPSEKLVKGSLDKTIHLTDNPSDIVNGASSSANSEILWQFSLPSFAPSGNNGIYILMYDVTAWYDGSHENYDGFAIFSGTFYVAKNTGYSAPVLAEISLKVSGKDTRNVYLYSSTKLARPQIISRIENGVRKYYAAIYYGASLHGKNAGLLGTWKWNTSVVPNGFIGDVVSYATYPARELYFDLEIDSSYFIDANTAITADKAKAFDSSFTGTDSIKTALDGKVPGTTLSISVPASSTRYVKMVVPSGYHHYLVFFNASMGVLHAEWLFRSYGVGGTAGTTVNYIGALVTARKWYVAGSSGNTFYIEFVNDSTSAQILNFKVCALDISDLPTLTVESSVPSGFVEQPVVGTVASQLLTARNLAVSLSNTSTDTPFDGHAAVTNIKTTGTLDVEHGGTGNTSVDTTPTANSTKMVTSGGIKTALDGKVDKVTGKGLSTNDFTDTYKSNVDSNTSARHTHSNKSVLDGISSTDVANWNAAEPNVQSDWNQTDSTADDYIKNKPMCGNIVVPNAKWLKLSIPRGTQALHASFMMQTSHGATQMLGVLCMNNYISGSTETITGVSICMLRGGKNAGQNIDGVYVEDDGNGYKNFYLYFGDDNAQHNVYWTWAGGTNNITLSIVDSVSDSTSAMGHSYLPVIAKNIADSSISVGSDTQPVYISNNGRIEACKKLVQAVTSIDTSNMNPEVLYVM